MIGTVAIELPFKQKEMQNQASQIYAWIHIRGIMP